MANHKPTSPTTTPCTKRRPAAAKTVLPDLASVRGFLSGLTAVCVQPSAAASCLSARVTFATLPNHVLLMRLTGAVTPFALDRFTEELISRFGARATGWVIDFTGAVLLADEDDRPRMGRTAARDSLKRAGGYVATVEQFEFIRDLAGECARRGHGRRCFYTAQAAYEWVLSDIRRKL